MSDEQDESMPWEHSAAEAVAHVLESAAWDFENKTVTIEQESEDGGVDKTEIEDYDSLILALQDIYENAWNAEVPFDGGEPVFETESADEVASILADYREQLDKMGW